MREDWRRELADLVGIPSVSADAARTLDVRAAGHWICRFIRDMGGKAKLVGGAPGVVVGKVPASTRPSASPTALCYGHFDVQPPGLSEAWNSDPFTLIVREGWVQGRGIADDKGQLWMLLAAARRLSSSGALPINLLFVCDGEEEVCGTTATDVVLSDNRPVDAAIVFDGGMPKVDLPTFCVATRGLLAFDVTARTGARDLHSGRFGGVALNAVHALMAALTAVVARDGQLSDELRADATRLDPKSFDKARLPLPADQIAEAGGRPLDSRAEARFFERTWAEPSLDVNGIVGGHPGLRNTALPVSATANFTVRVAPGQDVEAIGDAVERRLHAAVPAGTELEVRREGTAPAVVGHDDAVLTIGLDAFERALGVRPAIVRMGGTLPIMTALATRGIPTILTGFATPDSNVHAPNERLLVRYLDSGVAAACELFRGLARLEARAR